MESSQLAEKRPWELPWWKPSDGNRKTFTYIVSIHVLALVGIFLFPIPGWGLFLLVLAVISCGGLGTSLCYHRALAHRSEEHTSELQSHVNIVCRLLLEKKMLLSS